AEFDAGIGDMRAYGGLGAVQQKSHFLRRQSFHVSQRERCALAWREQTEAGIEILTYLGPHEELFGIVIVPPQCVVKLGEGNPIALTHKVDGGISGDAREPVCSLLFIFE